LYRRTDDRETERIFETSEGLFQSSGRICSINDRRSIDERGGNEEGEEEEGGRSTEKIGVAAVLSSWPSTFLDSYFVLRLRRFYK